MAETDAQVVAVTRDLFLQSRIGEIASLLGLKTAFVSGEDELKTVLESHKPSLVILDLAATEYDPFSCAKTVKSVSPSIKMLGFFPHMRIELKSRAQSSGVDYIVPNSGLVAVLGKVLSGELAR